MVCGAVWIRGRGWARVVSFPDVSEKFNPADRAAWGNRGSGIVCIVYDVQGTQDGRGTRDIYVAAFIDGKGKSVREPRLW